MKSWSHNLKSKCFGLIKKNASLTFLQRTWPVFKTQPVVTWILKRSCLIICSFFLGCWKRFKWADWLPDPSCYRSATWRFYLWSRKGIKLSRDPICRYWVLGEILGRTCQIIEFCQSRLLPGGQYLISFFLMHPELSVDHSNIKEFLLLFFTGLWVVTLQDQNN